MVGEKYYRCLNKECDVFYRAGTDEYGAKGARCPNCGEAELALVVVGEASKMEPGPMLEEASKLLDLIVCLIPTGEVRNQVCDANILVLSAREGVRE